MTLLELLALLRKHITLVVALPLVCAFVTAVYCWGVMPNEYTAEVSIYALSKNASNSKPEEAVTYSDLQSSQLLANDFAELAKNDQIRENTAASLGMEDLSGYKISVTSSTTTRILKVEVTGRNPEDAALIANKLATEIGQTAVRVMGIEAVNVVNEAQVPTEPSGPQRALYTLVALLAGLFIAVAIVVLRDMLDTTVRSAEDIEELLNVPVVGRFPYEKKGKR